MKLNGMPFAVPRAVTRIACNVSQQRLAPSLGSHKAVILPWTRSRTNVLLGRLCRQGGGKTTPIAWSWWVAGAIRSQPCTEETGAVSTCEGLVEKTGGLRRHGFVCSLDTDRL